MKLYRITFFKKVPGTSETYGAKSVIGNLDCACKSLVKKFGVYAPVRVIGPGVYRIANGEAELEVMR